MSGTQMSDAQFQQLIATIRALAPTVDADANKSKGSFSKCSTMFSGQYDDDAVEEFIATIEAYKDVEGISDHDALRGLPLLFFDAASAWWKGVRRDAKTWDDAIKMLREHFSPTKPTFQIYMEIFDERQGDSEAIDTFICKKRALLAKLPENRHDEETELDFIYGMLGLKYRQQMPRHEIKTFRELLEKGRTIEQTKD